MSKSFKGKTQNLIPQLHLKQAKKEKVLIPHPKNNKLNIYKSGRTFGKDITNSNYPIIPINSLNQNQKKVSNI